MPGRRIGVMILLLLSNDPFVTILFSHHRDHRGHREKEFIFSLFSLCPLCPLWLIYKKGVKK